MLVEEGLRLARIEEVMWVNLKRGTEVGEQSERTEWWGG